MFESSVKVIGETKGIISNRRKFTKLNKTSDFPMEIVSNLHVAFTHMDKPELDRNLSRAGQEALKC